MLLKRLYFCVKEFPLLINLNAAYNNMFLQSFIVMFDTLVTSKKLCRNKYAESDFFSFVQQILIVKLAFLLGWTWLR